MGGLAIFGSLLVFGESWYWLFVFEVVLIYICSEILVSNLPRSLSTAMKWNCIRQDGSWSTNRESTELKAIVKLRWDIRVVWLLVLIPTTMLTYLVDQEVMQLTTGFRGLVSLTLTDQESRENLVKVEESFDNWASGAYFTKSLGIDTEQHKRLLWHFWPFALVGALFWLVGCWVAIKKSYLYQLKELSDGIKQRRINYIQWDRAHGC